MALKERLAINLDEAIRNPALKDQKEQYPWRKEYEKLNYDNDSLPLTPIEDKGKGPHTLTHALLPALASTNDKALAQKKLLAICARLVLADFNPDLVRTGWTIRLENNVLYIERPKSKKAPKIGLKLSKDATVEAGYQEIQSSRDKIIEKGQQAWKSLADVIETGISYDAIVAMYGKDYGNIKLNRAKRGEIWKKEMGETEKFTGKGGQNKKILQHLKKKLEEIKDEQATVAPAVPAVEPGTPAPAVEPDLPAPAAEPTTPAPAVEPTVPAPGPELPEPSVEPDLPAPAVEPTTPPPAEEPSTPAPSEKPMTWDDVEKHLKEQREYWTKAMSDKSIRDTMEIQQGYWKFVMGRQEPYDGGSEQRAEVDEHFRKATQPQTEPTVPAPSAEPAPEVQKEIDATKAALEALRAYLNSPEIAQIFADFYAHPKITQDHKDEVRNIWEGVAIGYFKKLESKVAGLPLSGEDPKALREDIENRAMLEGMIQGLKEQLTEANATPAPAVEPEQVPPPVVEPAAPESDPEPEATPVAEEDEQPSREDLAKAESARARVKAEREAEFTPPSLPDKLSDAYTAHLVRQYDQAGGKLRRIYDALSTEDQKNIEEDPSWNALRFVRNGVRYEIEPIENTDNVRIKVENDGRVTTQTISINDLPGEIEKLAKTNQGTLTPHRPEAYPTAEETFDTNLINPNRTEEGLLRNVFHKIELSDEQQIITDSAGKQYKLDLKNGVKDNYENEPHTVTRLVTCYPVDDFGNLDKQGHLEIQFRRNDKSVIGIKYSNTTGDRLAPSTTVKLPENHPLLKLELVR